MPMQSLEEELQRTLINYPFKVRFAGFESDTRTLASQGWELSVRQQFDMRFGRPEMQLAMHIGPDRGGMYAISRPSNVDYHKMFWGGRMFEQLREFAEIGFDIMCMSSDIFFRVPVRESVGISFKDSFMPMDANPSFRSMEEVSIKDFKFFRTANVESKDLIVDPNDVPQLLEMVLKAQSKVQKEIDKRERSRKNEEAYRSGEMFAKPAHKVEAQIITLAV